MGLVTTCTRIARRMGYRTSKFVKIIDWRLALSNLALQVLITFYVLYALINGKTYLETEVPVGRVTNWGNGNANVYALQTSSAAARRMTTSKFVKLSEFYDVRRENVPGASVRGHEHPGRIQV